MPDGSLQTVLVPQVYAKVKPGDIDGSASINLSQDKMHSNYDSVVEQTGIFAGKGGYDITVGGHTQLDGAVIGSTATADKNKLDTGTLGWGGYRQPRRF